MSNYLTTPSRPSMGLGTGIGMNAFVGYPTVPAPQATGACCASCSQGMGEVDFKSIGIAALIILGAFTLLPWALGKG